MQLAALTRSLKLSFLVMAVACGQGATSPGSDAGASAPSGNPGESLGTGGAQVGQTAGSESAGNNVTSDGIGGSGAAGNGSGTTSGGAGGRRMGDRGRGGAANGGAAPGAGGAQGASGTNVQVDPGSSAGQWVMGYYPLYQQDMYKPDEIDWTGLTHIVVGRVKADTDGSLVLDFDVSASAGPNQARDLASRAHTAGKQAILMLGGAQEGAKLRGACSNANRAKFVQNLVKAAADYGYDGLDLDWEDNVDEDLFLSLVDDLRAANPSLVLTVPGGAINPNITATISAKIIQIAKKVDRYNLMSYYPSTAAAGYGWLSWHNCPLDGWKSSTPVTIKDSLDRYAAQGVPKSKLGMGMAFYAICYTGSVTEPNQSTESATIAGGDNDFPLSKLFGPAGSYADTYRRWDSAAKQPYLSLPQADSHGCRYISYEDEESIVAKGTFSRQNGYGGIIIWTINQGYVRNRAGGSPNFLMQALKKGFLD